MKLKLEFCSLYFVLCKKQSALEFCSLNFVLCKKQSTKHKVQSTKYKELKLLPVLLFLLVVSAFAQAPDRQQFIRVEAPLIALTHVRVIDGTGAEPRDDQTIIISAGKIQSIGPSSGVSVPADARTLDLNGYTVLPGLVGMHNHMFFPMGGSPPMYSNMGSSFPRLYLALGVTTIRTTGSVAPYTDLELKRLIDAGRVLGPKMHITAPYLEGRGSFTPVMHELRDADDARRMVNYWADAGATSFKAYMNITRDELRAAVEEAHKRGLKVTGHLCSIGYREAAEIGIGGKRKPRGECQRHREGGDRF
jgi:imidazolonepropionase-like amidohydrolase